MKIADFGFVGPADGKYPQADGSLRLVSIVGTEIYMAPEIHKREPYDGKKVDIWAAGIILFGMVSCNHPWRLEEAA